LVDEQGFQELHRMTARPLRAYAARVLGNAAQAEDVVQDAYLRLLRKPPATRDPGELRALLFRIASNLIVDTWRQQGRARRLERQQGAEPGRSADIPSQLDMARVFAELPVHQRQMLWLAYVEGADHREIAAALGLSKGSVRVLLHRLRHKLARLLRPAGLSKAER
jgi:RNA polymerase sigma-70 factor (ECF subfamily)